MIQDVSCWDCRYAKRPTVCLACGNETDNFLCVHEVALLDWPGGISMGDMRSRFGPCVGGKLFEAVEA